MRRRPSRLRRQKPPVSFGPPGVGRGGSADAYSVKRPVSETGTTRLKSRDFEAEEGFSKKGNG